MKNILNRLALWQKFALLGGFAAILALAPFTLYMREANKIVSAAELESQGLAPIRMLLKAMLLVQQHRGLSAIALSGDDNAQAQRAAKQAEVDKAMEAADAVERGIADATLQQQWQDIRSRWAALPGKVAQRSLTPKQSFEEHTALVGQILLLNEALADHFGVSLDPGEDSYHLVDAALNQAPVLMETLGRMRARGAGILAAKAATVEERGTMMAFAEKVTDYDGATARALEKAMSINPALRDKLAGPLQAAKDNVAQSLKLAREQVIAPEQFSYSAPDYFAKVTDTIGSHVKLQDAAIDELQRLVEVRRSSLRRTELLLLLGLGVLAVLGGAIAYIVVRSITEPMQQAVDYAKRVASGDLTAQIKVESQNETGQLLQALKDMNESLVRIVSEVRSGTETIASASNQIAAGNMDLSSRTEQQAGSLEETAASMEELTGTVKQNADNAMQANELALSASQVAGKGGEMVAHVVDTMDSINTSSRKIVDIISVIDGIAFQTNILALNAAVEAARAGEQGRGFAVVATEVRNLAQRSAAAAKEIKELITDSVSKVDAGAKLVDETGATMQEIVSSIKRVSDIIAEITGASREQSTGIEQVNEAITQMDETTQQNAALVEEAAAAAAALKDQADNLAMVVSVFKLDHSQAPQLAAAPQSRAAAPARATVTRIASQQKKLTAR